MDRLQPNSSLYNIPLAFRICGALDIPVLRASLLEIVRRHDVLRTRFPDEEGVPGQVVEPHADVPLPVHDLSGFPESEREAESERRLQTEADAPFSLADGPLLRASLLRLADQEHVLLLVFHHIVFDGGSRAVLVTELEALYAAGLRREKADLPELRLRYAEYAAWEREQDRGEALDYWRRTFKDVPPRLQLPMEHNRPAVETYTGALERFTVDAEVSRRLSTLSQSEGTTPFVTLLTTFQILLSRYTGQLDIAVAVPVLGRSRPDLDPLIGCFVNTLPVRVDLSGNPTFREALERVGDQTLDAFDHMDTQFDEIVRAVQPERDPSYTPLVQVSFGMLGDGMTDCLRLPGLAVEELVPRRTTAKFDLSLDILHTEDGLTGEVEYNVGLFDRPTIRRTIGHLLRLLEAVAADPDQRMSELPLLSAEEWQRTVVDWNHTDVEVPGPKLMHRLFEEQARRTPEATALVHGDERISYAELECRANQLAHLLRERGIGPETSVGVCMPRSVHTVVTLLGILKVGGVYAPMDPEYPADRLTFMLEDSRVKLLVTDSWTLSVLPDCGVERLLLDQERDRIASLPTTAPESGAVPGNLACMFYTSGSSGRPKCGMLTHANYVNYYRFWERTYLRGTPMKVHMQMTSFAFDIFIADTTRALFSGATLVIVPREVVMSPADLYALMVAEKVNSAEFITPILAALVDYVEETGQTLKFMDLLCAGSDIWYARDFLRTKRLCKPSTRVIAAYGTSETSNDNSTFEHTEGFGELEGIVPIGRPVANTRLYVLDEQMRPVPVGVPGELYIGGLSLGRGYHRRPGLTAERFVPDPLSGEAGSRLYRTGDLARCRPDGTLEILGRMDNQVKIRGFRVELGEIETALRAHAAVDHAVVIAHASASGEKRLVAYLTFHPEAADQADPADLVADVRGQLEADLPAYMVPSAFVRLDEMPLSANGKLDRRALPAPTEEQLSGDAPYVAPRTPVEEILAGIWSTVLGRTKVGVHDDFFALGGSSLLMTQVVSRIRAVWAVDIPVRALYRFPTVASLAGHVVSLGRDVGAARKPLTRVTGEGQELFETSYAQQQLWFHEQLDPTSPAYNVPTALRLRGPLDRAALQDALQAVVDRHATLRTVFLVGEGRLRQSVLPQLACPIRWVDLSGLPEDAQRAEERRHIEEDERRPFDLASGPLIRATALCCAPDEHVLLLSMHHIVTDGWSTPVLFDELSALYTARLDDVPAELPELAVEYTDFAAWQREWLQGEEAQAHLAHWRERLADAPPVTALPVDRPRSQLRGHAGGCVPLHVPTELHTRIKEQSRSAGATLFMTLLASFQALLSRYSGETDIVVGTPTAGRTHLETEQLVGFFVNMLPLRTDLSGDPTFRELVNRVRETALDAYAHQDLPFEKIVEAVQPPRGAYHNPVFQTVFVLDDTPSRGLRLPGLTTEELPVVYSAAKFDLSLMLADDRSGLSGVLTYKSDLFDGATVRRLADEWLALLEAVAADPELTLGALPPAAPPSRAVRPEPPALAEAPAPVAPRTPLEEVLAAIWCEVLGIDEPSVHDNFFLLGGYSLLVTRLALTVEELLGLKVPVRAVFENPTIATLVERLEPTLTPAERDRLEALLDVPAEADDDLPAPTGRP
ncbi:amino acid adenylation domain-containing protein [Streptomyces demainii]|uniref:Amino acid adenylation domain-containing protein n=2 Tax=Streptomyces demainii TaxID=588122 RepID=A0ABT9L6V9_9ACTN|nr:amino acid adenylation domain-containing protein [Streptomyces demainii]